MVVNQGDVAVNWGGSPRPEEPAAAQVLDVTQATFATLHLENKSMTEQLLKAKDDEIATLKARVEEHELKLSRRKEKLVAKKATVKAQKEELLGQTQEIKTQKKEIKHLRARVEELEQQ